MLWPRTVFVLLGLSLMASSYDLTRERRKGSDKRLKKRWHIAACSACGSVWQNAKRFSILTLRRRVRMDDIYTPCTRRQCEYLFTVREAAGEACDWTEGGRLQWNTEVTRSASWGRYYGGSCKLPFQRFQWQLTWMFISIVRFKHPHQCGKTASYELC